MVACPIMLRTRTTGRRRPGGLVKMEAETNQERREGAMSDTNQRGSWMEYDVVVEKNVRVPMRDGVRLAADLYLPARNGKVAEGRFPAVMERTPYDKEGKVNEGRYFARRGYVAVMQDVRGRFQSEG